MTGTTRSRGRRVGLKLSLAAGYVALAIALIAARGEPVRGFELSIYEATPTLFWAGVGTALLSSLLVSFSPDSPRRIFHAALALAGASIWAVVALPVIRGYAFYGGGDALSHLGFAKMFAAGSMSPLSLLHPGVHLTSIGVDAVAGTGLRRGMMMAVLVFFAVYFAFVPLCVRAITDDDRATAVGVFSAVLLLPINNVSVHVVAHPTSQAILYAPFVLFLLFVYLARAGNANGEDAAGDGNGDGRVDVGRGRWRPSRIGILLSIAAVSLVFVHPEEALNVIAIFGTVVLLGLVYRRYRPGHPFGRTSPLYAQTAIVGAVFLAWAPRSTRTQSRLSQLIERTTLGGAPTTEGGGVSHYAGSLAAIGGSLEELFVKLFLASLVFVVLAGVIMLASLTGRLDDVFPNRNAYTKYLTLSFGPLLLGTGVIYVASFGDHYFRYIGFLMMLATILGAVALVRAIPFLLSRVGVDTLRRATIVLFALMLPLAVLSIHPSPWIYNPSPGITEQRVEGYYTSFEHRSPDVAYAGVRGGPRRYVESYYGPTTQAAIEFPGDRSEIPPPVFNTNVTTYYDEPRYVPVSDADIGRELVLYEGFRYRRAGFVALETGPGSHRVQSNGAFRLYLLADER